MVGLLLQIFIVFLLPVCKKVADTEEKGVKLGFTDEEATIADTHTAIKAGHITCR